MNTTGLIRGVEGRVSHRVATVTQSSRAQASAPEASHQIHSLRTFVATLRLGTVLAALLACCFAAGATTLEKMTLARMSHAADVIVRAGCVSNSTVWDAGKIWTITTFEAIDAWKGAPPETITVWLLGGTLGNLKSSVSGVPWFRVGEEVVLFLEPNPRGDYSVVSWVQGTFRIRVDASSGEETVTQDTAAFATIDPQTRRFEPSGIRSLPLAAFRACVQAALAQRTETKR